MTSELILAALLAAPPCTAPGDVQPGAASRSAPAFADAIPDGPPPYYMFDLVPTKRVPGTGAATGEAAVRFAPSPFGITLAPDGSYALDVHLSIERLVERGDGSVYAVWLTTPSLERVVRAGSLTGPGEVAARSAWNKFLVVVTLEPSDDPSAATWSGPVVLRGMSRSGMMHTMAGHGPFEQENCAAYGYD